MSVADELNDMLSEIRDYKINEKVLGYSNTHLYHGIILDIRPYALKSNVFQYLIHYTRFSSNYDEWVLANKILPCNAHTMDLRRRMREEAKKIRQNDSPKKSSSDSSLRKSSKKRDISTSNNHDHIETTQTTTNGRKKVKMDESYLSGVGKRHCTIVIPGILKKRMLYSWDRINNHKELFKVPANITVANVIDQFISSRKLSKQKTRICNELAEGFLLYFDRILPHALLLQIEQSQYDITHKKYPHLLPRDLYNAEFIVRCLIQLPPSLSALSMPTLQVAMMQDFIDSLLKWMEKHPGCFLCGFEREETK